MSELQTKLVWLIRHALDEFVACLAWQQLLIHCNAVLAEEKYFLEVFYKTILKLWIYSKFITQKISTPHRLQNKAEISHKF